MACGPVAGVGVLACGGRIRVRVRVRAIGRPAAYPAEPGPAPGRVRRGVRRELGGRWWRGHGGGALADGELDRGYVRGIEAEDLPIEGEFGLQARDQRVGAPETM